MWKKFKHLFNTKGWFSGGLGILLYLVIKYILWPYI